MLRIHYTFLLVLAVICAGCNAPDHLASFSDHASNTITIELRASHPYLAEYDRTLVVSSNSHPVVRQQLAKDTGGYTAANLYRCSSVIYQLDDYSGSFVINLANGSISVGKCPGNSVYIGIFDGGGSDPWLFFPSSVRGPSSLQMYGG